MLNQYLTNIYVLKTNVSNLYFNILKEENSLIKKDILSDLDNITKFYLKLGSLIKKIGANPIMDIEEIKKISSIKEISSQDYTTKEALNILYNNLCIINKMNNQVGEYALKNFKFSSINLVLEFNKYLEKRVGELNISDQLIRNLN